MSDMAGYAARVAVERSGSCRDTMEPRGRERPTFAEATSWHRIDGKPIGRSRRERTSQFQWSD